MAAKGSGPAVTSRPAGLDLWSETEDPADLFTLDLDQDLDQDQDQDLDLVQVLVQVPGSGPDQLPDRL